jgi:hypothetical protein
MPARRDTRIEASRLRRFSPLQAIEDQSQTWGRRCHSCTWREGFAPSWPLSCKVHHYLTVCPEASASFRPTGRTYASFPETVPHETRLPWRRKPMTTTATHHGHDTTPERVLCVAFELREKPWQLGCTTGHGQKPRARRLAACHQVHVLPEVAPATKRFGRPDTAPVVRCDAAGRAGCGRPRFFPAPGIPNPGVDSSSIEVNRRQRRAKSAGWDVRQW